MRKGGKDQNQGKWLGDESDLRNRIEELEASEARREAHRNLQYKVMAVIVTIAFIAWIWGIFFE